MEYTSNNNIVYSCKYHVVWCSKHRRKVLVNGIDTLQKELINQVCQEIHVDLIEMEKAKYVIAVEKKIRMTKTWQFENVSVQNAV